MCNAYYTIITGHLRQAFFEEILIFSKNTRYCTFFVFLSFTPHSQFIKLLFIYQFHSFLSNIFLTNLGLLQAESKITSPKSVCRYSNANNPRRFWKSSGIIYNGIYFLSLSFKWNLLLNLDLDNLSKISFIILFSYTSI